MATDCATRSPEALIDNIDGLMRQLTARISHLRDEADDIGAEWEGLCRAGGRRADHAAKLLGKLRPHLGGLATFALQVAEQLEELEADPFQRGDGLWSV